MVLGKRDNCETGQPKHYLVLVQVFEPHYDKNVASLAFCLFQTGSQVRKILKIL